jgi:hypothetical protein
MEKPGRPGRPVAPPSACKAISHQKQAFHNKPKRLSIQDFTSKKPEFKASADKAKV